jgi:prolipoprotein diacylglyceryltransferase
MAADAIMRPFQKAGHVLHIGQFPPVYHLVIEMIAFWVAFRLYLTLKKRDSLNLQKRVAILIGGILGAAIGSKLLYFLEDPGLFISLLPNWQSLMEGKSLVGALTGGWVGIELAKKINKVKSATGDSFVLPLAVAIMVGRIGCFLTGFYDHTYGTPTDLPWGFDFGDGTRRHPAQLYEIAFLGCFVAMWPKLAKMQFEQGELWKIFILSYMTFRFFVEFFKPVQHVYLGLDIEQLIAIGVWIYYAPYLISKLQQRRMVEADEA